MPPSSLPRRWAASLRALLLALALVLPTLALAPAATASVPGPYAAPSVNGGSGCMIKTGGTLWCWGWGAYGQLGQGTHAVNVSAKNTPTQTGTASDWAQVSPGTNHMCAVKTTGQLWCWGRNDTGQVGIGSTVLYVDNPTRVGTASNWRSVSAGGWHTCALKTDATLWCWGTNTQRQLGDGTQTMRTRPVKIGTGTWRSLDLGDRHSGGIATTGALLCWGWNPEGQLGDGTTTSVAVPTQVTAFTTWTKVTAGFGNTCAIRTGQLWCWGGNTWGEIGDGTTVTRLVPTWVGTAANWTSVTTNGQLGKYVTPNPEDSATCGLRGTGQLFCWGKNGGGQLGDGTYVAKRVPTRIGTSSTWTSVDMGGGYWGGHACGQQSNRSVYCWGGNQDGDVGAGTWLPKNFATPQLVATPA